MKLIYFLALVHAAVCVEPPTVVLQDLGTVIGSVLQSRENRNIHAFQGIPFAESPSANRRFQPPVPKKWSGVLNATQPGIACAQPGLVHLKRLKRSLWDVAESRVQANDPEDCLLVSVYKPAESSSNDVLPVMVFVHGGSFIEGSASRFTPEYLLDRDVILVVPQYRLGPFGFLSLQNDIVPGNAGLLDIIESLKWVKKHIKSFGGNPEQVTLFGQSAGASIASYLMLSPLSEGLIHGVIANSGAAIASWSIDTEPVKHATQIATLAGCRNETSEELGQCLQNLPVNVLLNAFLMHAYAAQMKGGIALGGSLPVVSRAEEPKETKVVPVHPADKIEKGNYVHLPLLMGANRHEAMFVVNLIYDSVLKPGNLHENEEYIRNVFPQYVVENCGYSDVSMVVTDMMEEKYFKHVPQEDRGNFSEILPGVLDFFSTALFKAPGYRTVQLNSASSLANYWYSFNYQGRFHIPENGIDPGGLFSEGVAHSDEMIYLTPRVNETFNENELKLSKMMVDMWVNFATSGNPNMPNTADVPEWPAYDMQNEFYLDINIESKRRAHYPFEYTAAIQDALKSSASSWIFHLPLISLLGWTLCALL